MVNTSAPSLRGAGPVSRIALRLVFALVVGMGLLAGIAGGLLRVGIAWGDERATAVLQRAAVDHAFLMVCAFMGTVIGIERAIALRRGWAFLAPACTAAGGAALLCGARPAALWLAVAGSVVFVGVNGAVVARQRADHTVLLLVAAVAWVMANLAHALALQTGAAVPLWLSLLVLTIAAERLEMARLMRRRPGATAWLYGIVAVLLAGAVASGFRPTAGGVAYGGGLLALACWLAVFDIARRTVRAQGLSRYMAVCLLSGYGWLAVAGAAWIAMALGQGFRDAALHALALGFVFSMVMGHAPVILPAVARVKLAYGWAFYLPLLALHLTLVWRLGAGHFNGQAQALGALGNAVAIALFVATVLAAALLWRWRASRLSHSSYRHGTPHVH